MNPHPIAYLLNLAITHPAWSAVVLYWLYNDLVDSLPEPNGNKFYQFAYAFLNKVAGNLSVAFSSKIPGATPPPANTNTPVTK